ncbi:VOC family protein [Nocardia arthritidis]|uniref:VOC family protein n=1 Tax=Nocardia arthritidis TaxID=228602 RepID=A0A6G9YLM1_9NOCA|nr:VOC family protein [Nocardia arthritidis]QIS14195.1 VOC family protein [Nocardia arthritidis]
MDATSTGQVSWFEFLTPDPTVLEKFYGQLLGWTFESGPGGTDVRILAPGAASPMGTLVETDSGGDHLRVAISSADIAADVAKLVALGASLAGPVTERSALLADPRGNAFTLASGPQSAPEFPPRHGSLAWFELGTTEPKSVAAFYTEAFGWRFEFDENAGAQYYNIFTGPQWPTGGMYDLQPDGPEYLIPAYLVGDVPTLSEVAETLGGVVEFGPAGCPDGLLYSRVIDPNGNRFEIFSAPGM